MYSTFFTGTGTNPAWVERGEREREASRDWQDAQTCLQEELILAFNILAWLLNLKTLHLAHTVKVLLFHGYM